MSSYWAERDRVAGRWRVVERAADPERAERIEALGRDLLTLWQFGTEHFADPSDALVVVTCCGAGHGRRVLARVFGDGRVAVVGWRGPQARNNPRAEAFSPKQWHLHVRCLVHRAPVELWADDVAECANIARRRGRAYTIELDTAVARSTAAG